MSIAMPSVSNVLDIIGVGALEGDRFVAGRVFSNVGSNRTINIVLENPTDGSPEPIHAAIEPPTTGASNLTDIDVLKNVSVDSAGVSQEPRNVRTSEPDDAEMNVQTEATISGGTEISEGFIGGFSRGSGIINVEEKRVPLIIEPGDNVALLATNSDRVTQDRVSLEMDFAEFSTEAIS